MKHAILTMPSSKNAMEKPGKIVTAVHISSLIVIFMHVSMNPTGEE